MYYIKENIPKKKKKKKYRCRSKSDKTYELGI